MPGKKTLKEKEGKKIPQTLILVILKLEFQLKSHMKDP